MEEIKGSGYAREIAGARPKGNLQTLWVMKPRLRLGRVSFVGGKCSSWLPQAGCLEGQASPEDDFSLSGVGWRGSFGCKPLRQSLIPSSFSPLVQRSSSF